MVGKEDAVALRELAAKGVVVTGMLGKKKIVQFGEPTKAVLNEIASRIERTTPLKELLKLILTRASWTLPVNMVEKVQAIIDS